jgi:hypothetical protein
MSQTEETASKPEVRFGFVELLFALVAAEIATQTAKVIIQGAGPASYAAYSDLVLSLFVVASSWVGWTHSGAPGNRADVREVFSWPFVVLILDVLLVVAYFFLVTSATLHLSDPPDKLTARNSSGSLCLVFVGYLLWDLVTRIIMDTPEGRTGIFWSRIWISAACVLFSLGAWFWLRDARGVLAVVLADLGLLALVVVFRALKQGHRLAAVIAMAGFLVLLPLAKSASS